MDLKGPPLTFDEIPGTSAPLISPSKTSFACISLNIRDRIRLIQFPQHDITAISSVIQSSWPRGIQDQRNYSSAYEFKLKGYPWIGRGSEAISSRIVLREIFAYLFSVGWILYASTDISKKEDDKDTMIFRKQRLPPPESQWISISFNQSDRLRLIGADADLIAAFGELLRNMNLLKEEFWKERQSNAWEFKLHGYPWYARGEESVKTRLLGLRMIETLENHGWSLYSSLDQSDGQGETTSDADSWFCVRDKQWVPGMTTFH